MFIAALFTMVKKWQRPKCPSTAVPSLYSILSEIPVTRTLPIVPMKVPEMTLLLSLSHVSIP